MRRLVALILAALAFVQPSAALTPAQELVLFGGGTTYYANPTSGSIPSWLSYASAGVRYYWDASGNLQTSPNNLIPNSAMQGAAVGVFPTGWVQNNSAAGTVSASVVATGNDSGYTYVDVLFSGTTTGTGYYSVGFSPVIAASTGQSMVYSVATKLVSGSIPGSIKANTNINNGSGYIAEADFTPFTGASPLTITSGAFTIASAGVVSVQPFVTFQFTGVVSPNFTLRIAAPQLSQVTPAQTTPSAFMPTSSGAYYGPVVNDHNPATLAALGLRSEPQQTNLFLNNLSPAPQTIPVANSATYTISFFGTGTIAWAGACTGSLTGTGATTLAQTSCTTATTSLVITTLTGAIAYPQVGLSPFATSRILTYGSAVTVPADNWSFTGAVLARMVNPKGACVAMQAQAEGASPGKTIWMASDGTFNNYISPFYGTGNALAINTSIAGVFNQYVGPSGGDYTTAPRTQVTSYGKGTIIQGYDGGTPVVSAKATSTNYTSVIIGSISPTASAPIWVSQIMIRPSCTAAQVQRLSTAGANLRASNDNELPVFAANDNLPLIVKIASGE